jgi:hypothetical protein
VKLEQKQLTWLQRLEPGGARRPEVYFCQIWRRSKMIEPGTISNRNDELDIHTPLTSHMKATSA